MKLGPYRVVDNLGNEGEADGLAAARLCVGTFLEEGATIAVIEFSTGWLAFYLHTDEGDLSTKPSTYPQAFSTGTWGEKGRSEAV